MCTVVCFLNNNNLFLPVDWVQAKPGGGGGGLFNNAVVSLLPKLHLLSKGGPIFSRLETAIPIFSNKIQLLPRKLNKVWCTSFRCTPTKI